jgi:xanthine dehydrogenase accessory factor
MIGSRKKIVMVRESFLKNGWATAEKWDKIHTPIGLEIGSKTVQEIAVSIAAQLIQVRNQLKNR